jgi:hypothetical protein
MFVGHYSVAFACRTDRNKIPLWVLFIAVQFLDYIWATLVLLGIEKLRVIKGFTAGSMLDSYFHPYSHSLITAVMWSVIAALAYKGLCTRHRCHYSKSAPSDRRPGSFLALDSGSYCAPSRSTDL